nr:T9SS type A sorting domain-containing protein [Cytophagales bacterium]
MKTQTSTLSIIILLMLFAQPIFATDYYFSDLSGDDSRSASMAQNPSTPWKSIAKLNQIFSTLNPGDAVYFKRGEKFYGTIHINKSGSSTNPIKIGAYGSGAKPVITSFLQAKSWSQLSSTQYESGALNTSEVQVVLLNGKRIEMGRFPNGDQDNEGYITISSVPSSNSISGTFPSGSSNWTGGEVVIKKLQWVIDAHKITNHSGSTLTFNIGRTDYPAKPGFGFFIQNHPNTLDQFGEWFFNASTKKLRLHFASQVPSTSVVEYASQPYLITKSSNTSHIIIENLHLKGANKDGIYFAAGDNVKISKVDIDYAGEEGMHILSHSNLIIDDCAVNYAYNNGMFLRFGNAGAVVKNNKLSKIATQPGRTRNGDGCGVGIFAVSDNILIERNRVDSVGYNGIQFNGNNTIVQHNLIDTYCLIKGDGGGIYTFGGHNNPDVYNRKVLENIILNGIGSKGGLAYTTNSGFNPQAEGIFLDDNSNGIEIRGNSIADANSGIKMSNSYNVQVINNTIYNSNMLLNLGNSSIGKDTRNITVEGNIFFSKFANQNAYTIRSHKNDILQMATFKKNHLFRPFGDTYSIYTRNPNSSGTMVENIYNLEKWTNASGNDVGSTSHTVDFEKFVVQERTTQNLFSNMGFNSNVSGLSANNATLTWIKELINGGTLQISPNSGASLKIDIGKVVQKKAYLIKFKAKAEKRVPIRVNLRHTGSPWAIISDRITFDIETSVKEYQTILTSDIDLDKASLIMAIPEAGSKIWIDDLEIVGVNVKHILPEDKLIFAYNNSSTAKTLSLNGDYIDAKNVAYTNSVNIAPFRSVALFRIGNSIIEAPAEPEPVPTTSDLDALAMNFGSPSTVTLGTETFAGENESYFTSATSVSINEMASTELLFQTGRFASSMNISIPMENGKYSVSTLHNETYFGLGGRPGGPGKRVFDISVQGKLVKKDFDLFLENANQETVLTFNDIEVVNNVLTINLSSSVNNAIISGVLIKKSDGTIETELTKLVTETTSKPATSDTAPIVSFNTFNSKSITYNGQQFVGEGAKYLKSSSTRVSNNSLASQEELFQSGRFSTDIAYEIPVPNGKYRVKTFHNETHFGVSGPDARANQRVFDISIEGKVVKEKLDMFVEFGNKETELTFDGIEVSDGILHIYLKSSVNNAIISAISVTTVLEAEPLVVETTPSGLYFSTGNQGSVTYLGASFSRIPSSYLVSGSSNNSTNSSASVEPLFQSGRFGKILSYSIPVPDGIYTIETYHKETFFGYNGRTASIGQRVFDIALEGNIVKSKLDMFAEYNNKEVRLVFKSVKVTGGQLNIDLTAIANNAIISGIGIIDESGKAILTTENLRGYREMDVQEERTPEAEKSDLQMTPILYPNPAQDYTHLSIHTVVEQQVVYIHNMAGQLIKALDASKFATAPGTITIPTSDIKDGLYLVSLVDGKGLSVKLRLIVKH